MRFKTPLGISLAAILAATTHAAQAEIVLYESDDTSFSADGYINVFYANTDVDLPGSDFDRRQSRVKMGFLPNWIGFNAKRQVGGLELMARSSFWVTINDSDQNGTETGIDVRQFYGTIGGDWGELLVGKDFGLFARSNIFLDQLLSGYGQVSDTLGLVDFGGVSFGNIGSGYPYSFPSAQITYRTPKAGGLRLAAGIFDPVHTTAESATGSRFEEVPRFESELTWETSLGGVDLYTWVNGQYQTSKSSDPGVESVTSRGLGYGVQASMGPATLAASGFNAEGINAFFTNNVGNAELREVDSDGYLLQAGYSFGANRIALSYGKTEDEQNDWELRTRGAAVFHSINDYLTLVGEVNRHDIAALSGGGKIEQTDTVALGVAMSW
ncbi:porin [Halomonas campisalis]|uniref:Porin n=1 Tax=Billgrantia campisalis TaxID=74661 RepID=A0ABS9P980_9GAMM|nr:porin [Halomonas campisalis]MCG6658196.1 porin [Halomonas campisalis]MDR5862864.1 porin [Halomonas campisalis]